MNHFYKKSHNQVLYLLVIILVTFFLVAGCSKNEEEPDLQSFIATFPDKENETITIKVFPEEWEPQGKKWKAVQRLDTEARKELHVVKVTGKTEVIDTRSTPAQEVSRYKLGPGHKVAVWLNQSGNRAERIKILEYTRQDYFKRIVSRKEGMYSLYAFTSVKEEMSKEEEAGYDKLFDYVSDNHKKYRFTSTALGSSDEKKFAEYFNIKEFPTYLILDNEGIVFRTHQASEVIEFLEEG